METLLDITVEPLGNRHIPGILRIEKDSFTTPWSASSFINEVYSPRSVSFAAVSEGVVIAYLCANYIVDEGHILNLAVHPSYRRKGISRYLLCRALSMMKAKGCRAVYLEVRESNAPARNLYGSLGFKEVGRRRLYYFQPLEDAVIMVLNL